MFPWSPEFAWDPYHVAFFGALYSVFATVGAGLSLAAWRSLRDAREGRAGAIVWRADFDEMPPSARSCRHQITGEVAARTCENGFDCRRCADHPRLAALRLESAPTSERERCGVEVPQDRLYHRGHTWLRPEPDGTLVVGLDDLACRLVGTPDRLEVPSPGARIEVNGPVLRARCRGRDVRVLSPVDGTVVDVRGSGAGLTLRVDAGSRPDLRHLLSGPEAGAWMLREMERLQRALGAQGLGPALADGGELVADVGAVLPGERYDALLGEMLLEP
jgi:hypothetical protein